MSSILTNNSAMVALQTLKSVNQNLSMTQSEISTGKSVASAKDNAAVWAISKQMDSDVKGFKAISESLNLGQATVATARQAAETVTDLLTEMKGRIVAAQEENVDRGSIQTDIVALRDQIEDVVNAAQFNGLNLIDGSSTDDMEVLASLNRDSNGIVSSEKIGVTRQNLSVSGTVSTQTMGVVAAADADLVMQDAAGAVGTEDALANNAEFDPTSPGSTLADNASFEFDIKQTSEGASYRVILDDLNVNVSGGGQTLGQRTFEYVASATDGTADVARELTAQMNAFFDAATASGEGYSASFAVDGTTGNARVTIDNALGGSTAAIGIGLAVGTGGTPGTTSAATGLAALSSIDVTSDAEGALTAIDGLIDTAISAAASFGSDQGRIETQTEFVSKLTDSFKSGIGALVDADMEEASAKLQALQVQQQLAVQALSIANQAPQQILSLFR
ncbi:flagellin N-terminal helical domain-containing protein [Roseobacteraceae bacterium S113]